MKVIYVAGCVLLWVLRVLLLPVRAGLWLLGLAVDFAGSVVCRIASSLGTLFLIGVVLSHAWTGLSDALFLEGIVIGILMVVIPRALTILSAELVAGIQSLLRKI
ncbi:MAG: hypothetical protein LKG40_03680 [Lachnospiraceae bacterium]|jgi:hypothetical protein|nr:hypothetical protein [Lachnospiraceae bacterium]MCI1327966.1 hypothetical protein [Lachnospiraceae bacterium]